MNNVFSIQEKTILVTGAASGIGAAMSIEFSRQGANVIITDINEKGLNETFNQLQGDKNKLYVADLTNEEEISALINDIPILNGIVNNAGVNKRVPSSSIQTKDLDFVFGINFNSIVLLNKKLLKAKKIDNNASVVFTSSISVFKPAIGNALYAASKGAIDSYMRVLALELSSKKIRVNAIHPGMVWTSLIEKSSFDIDKYKEDEKKYPLGRYGKPKDIANVAIFLLSEASEWMTGSVITIDGGKSLI